MNHVPNKIQAGECSLSIFKWTINGKEYANAANNITHVNPISTATIVARAVLMTDTHPFIPHAQGIKAAFTFEICDRPAGKGIPMQNAKGAVIKNTISNFMYRWT